MTIQMALSRDARSSGSELRALEDYLNPLGGPQSSQRQPELPVAPPASPAAGFGLPPRPPGTPPLPPPSPAASFVIPQLPRLADLLFQVEAIEGSVRRVEVSIDTRERRDLQQVLVRLFESAELSADAQTARILRELVGS
jgi:hypothetical protein